MKRVRVTGDILLQRTRGVFELKKKLMYQYNSNTKRVRVTGDILLQRTRGVFELKKKLMYQYNSNTKRVRVYTIIKVERTRGDSNPGDRLSSNPSSHNFKHRPFRARARKGEYIKALRSNASAVYGTGFRKRFNQALSWHFKGFPKAGRISNAVQVDYNLDNYLTSPMSKYCGGYYIFGRGKSDIKIMTPAHQAPPPP